MKKYELLSVDFDIDQWEFLLSTNALTDLKSQFNIIDVNCGIPGHLYAIKKRFLKAKKAYSIDVRNNTINNNKHELFGPKRTYIDVLQDELNFVSIEDDINNEYIQNEMKKFFENEEVSLKIIDASIEKKEIKIVENLDIYSNVNYTYLYNVKDNESKIDSIYSNNKSFVYSKNKNGIKIIKHTIS